MEDIAMKKKKDRILYFLEFAYQTDIDNLKPADLWKVRNHLLKILDDDLTHHLYIDYVLADYKKDNSKIENLKHDLSDVQAGFKWFFDNMFISVLSQNFPDSSNKPEDIIRIPEIEKLGKYLCLDENVIRYDDYVKNLQDIGTEQLTRLCREGIQNYRYYICESCGNWQLNTRKKRKHWMCASCYKKKYDRELKKKERSTPEGRAAYRKYQKERYSKKYRKKCGV